MTGAMVTAHLSVSAPSFLYTGIAVRQKRTWHPTFSTRVEGAVHPERKVAMAASSWEVSLAMNVNCSPGSALSFASLILLHSSLCVQS